MIVKLLVVCALVVAAPVAGAKPHHKKPADPDAPKKPHHKGWSSPAAGPTESGDPELIFTFDDGPNPKTTPFVLDTLAKHHVHATFFLVGEMAANPKAAPIIDRMLREGHIVANHTMTHQDLCRRDEEVGARDIDDGRAAIVKAAPGWIPVWFRVPYGVRCDRVDKLLEDRHLTHFHWDLDGQEWKHNNTQKEIDYVEKQVDKMTGRNVLLMHDIKKATVESLPVILDWLEAENAQRKIDHKRQIRIIAGYELAAARLPTGLVDWMADATPDPVVWGTALANALP
jgi:peptidoglycan/xylan/chitin deacetylase (PgdA/CDA1 family)